MTRKQRRLALIGGALGVLGARGRRWCSSRCATRSCSSTSPTEVAAKRARARPRIRLGGLVEPGSVKRGDNRRRLRRHRRQGEPCRCAITGMLPDLFREGQGVVTEGALEAGGVFRADTVLAKHDETYMPQGSRRRAEGAGPLEGRLRQGAGQAPSGVARHDRRTRPFRAGPGAGAGARSSRSCRFSARARDDARADGVGAPTALTQFAFVALAFARADRRPMSSPTSRSPTSFENSHSPKPLLYKITGVWGNHEGSMLLWVLILASSARWSRLFGAQSAGDAAGQCAGRAGAGSRAAFLLFILLTSNPFARLVRPPFEGQRPQSGPAGHRPRDPSAAALSRLCRLLDRRSPSPSRR